MESPRGGELSPGGPEFFRETAALAKGDRSMFGAAPELEAAPSWATRAAAAWPGKLNRTLGSKWLKKTEHIPSTSSSGRPG